MPQPVAVIALATADFDPTEVAVPWKVLREAGVVVVFATEDGRPGACDPEMLTGVRLLGLAKVQATAPNIALYREMERDPAFLAPIRYADMDPATQHLLVLPGGHAPGMRQYLESELLQARTAAFLAADRPVGAICHGTVVLARVQDESGAPVLRGRSLTCLPKTLEWSAWAGTKWSRGDYFRTYPEWVQDEVARAAGARGSVEAGPLLPSYRRPFTVLDGKLLTARWPGDAQAFAEGLVRLVRDEAAAE